MGGICSSSDTKYAPLDPIEKNGKGGGAVPVKGGRTTKEREDQQSPHGDTDGGGGHHTPNGVDPALNSSPSTDYLSIKTTTNGTTSNSTSARPSVFVKDENGNGTGHDSDNNNTNQTTQPTNYHQRHLSLPALAIMADTVQTSDASTATPLPDWAKPHELSDEAAQEFAISAVQSSLFGACLSESDCRTLASSGYLRSCSLGAHIFSQHKAEQAQFIYIIESGEIHLELASEAAKNPDGPLPTNLDSPTSHDTFEDQIDEDDYPMSAGEIFHTSSPNLGTFLSPPHGRLTLAEAQASTLAAEAAEESRRQKEARDAHLARRAAELKKKDAERSERLKQTSDTQFKSMAGALLSQMAGGGNILGISSPTNAANNSHARTGSMGAAKEALKSAVEKSQSTASRPVPPAINVGLSSNSSSSNTSSPANIAHHQPHSSMSVSSNESPLGPPDSAPQPLSPVTKSPGPLTIPNDGGFIAPPIQLPPAHQLKHERSASSNGLPPLSPASPTGAPPPVSNPPIANSSLHPNTSKNRHQRNHSASILEEDGRGVEGGADGEQQPTSADGSAAQDGGIILTPGGATVTNGQQPHRPSHRGHLRRASFGPNGGSMQEFGSQSQQGGFGSGTYPELRPNSPSQSSLTPVAATNGAGRGGGSGQFNFTAPGLALPLQRRASLSSNGGHHSPPPASTAAIPTVLQVTPASPKNNAAGVSTIASPPEQSPIAGIGSLAVNSGDEVQHVDEIGPGIVRVAVLTKGQTIGLCGILSPQQIYHTTAVVHSPGTRLLCIPRSALMPFLRSASGSRLQDHLGRKLLQGLESAPWLRSLPPSALVTLSSLFQAYSVPAETTLFKLGDCTCDYSSLYYLIEGEVAIDIFDDRGKTLRKVFRGGSWVGELSVLIGLCRTGTVKTTTPCLVRFATRRTIFRFFHTFALLRLPSLAISGLLAAYPPLRDEQLLEQMTLQGSFARFCLKEFSAENIEFWQSAVRFRKVILTPSGSTGYDRRQVLTEAALLYTRYISERSLIQVNLKETVRSAVKSSMKTGVLHSETFKPAEDEILHLMIHDNFARFKNSKFYQQAKDELEPPQTWPFLSKNFLIDEVKYGAHDSDPDAEPPPLAQCISPLAPSPPSPPWEVESLSHCIRISLPALFAWNPSKVKSEEELLFTSDGFVMESMTLPTGSGNSALNSPHTDLSATTTTRSSQQLTPSHQQQQQQQKQLIARQSNASFHHDGQTTPSSKSGSTGTGGSGDPGTPHDQTLSSLQANGGSAIATPISPKAATTAAAAATHPAHERVLSSGVGPERGSLGMNKNSPSGHRRFGSTGAPLHPTGEEAKENLLQTMAAQQQQQSSASSGSSGGDDQPVVFGDTLSPLGGGANLTPAQRARQNRRASTMVRHQPSVVATAELKATAELILTQATISPTLASLTSANPFATASHYAFASVPMSKGTSKLNKRAREVAKQFKNSPFAISQAAKAKSQRRVSTVTPGPGAI